MNENDLQKRKSIFTFEQKEHPYLGVFFLLFLETIISVTSETWKMHLFTIMYQHHNYLCNICLIIKLISVLTEQ